MRNVFVAVCLLIAVLVSAARANPYRWPPGGDITPACDYSGFCGMFIERIPGLWSIHIVVTSGIGATACRFSAPIPQCSGAQFLSDSWVYPVTIGNSQEGVTVEFGSCRQVPVHALTINVFATGEGDECCFMWVRPAPDSESGEIEIVDCQDTVVYGEGGAAIFNPDRDYCISYVPAEKSTWGKVKSLYAE